MGSELRKCQIHILDIIVGTGIYLLKVIFHS